MGVRATNYVSMLELDPFDAGWVVGLIEGEGSFIVRLRQNKAGNSYIFDASVQLSSTDLEVLTRLESLVGGRVYGPRPKRGCKPCWKWSLHRRADVVHFCRLLLPRLSPRRQAQAQKLIAAYEQYARKE